MQIVAEKDTITKEVNDEELQTRFKDIEKVNITIFYQS